MLEIRRPDVPERASRAARSVIRGAGRRATVPATSVVIHGRRHPYLGRRARPDAIPLVGLGQAGLLSEYAAHLDPRPCRERVFVGPKLRREADTKRTAPVVDLERNRPA